MCPWLVFYFPHFGISPLTEIGICESSLSTPWASSPVVRSRKENTSPLSSAKWWDQFLGITFKTVPQTPPFWKTDSWIQNLKIASITDELQVSSNCASWSGTQILGTRLQTSVPILLLPEDFQVYFRKIGSCNYVVKHLSFCCSNNIKTRTKCSTLTGIRIVQGAGLGCVSFLDCEQLLKSAASSVNSFSFGFQGRV